ncbi:MAG: hypothetical protein IPK50_02210 [Fibrobacterota bacterium]|nr:MAG: hypothetical protein IPK50_02210 [Fibrobacterota bacterium]
MQNLASTLALSAILATTAQADWILSGYPVQAADSAAANKLYGIRTFSNPASATKIKVDSGRVVFHADYASDSTEGNSANVGFVHELRPGDDLLDPTGLTAISFQFKNSVAITGDLEISIGSSAYSDTMLAVGAVFKYVLRGSTVATGVSDWKTVELDIKDFYVDGANLDTLPRLESVLKKMTHLRIAPRSSYQDSGTQNGKPCAKCVKPTMPGLDLEIRNIVLKGIVKNPWPNPSGIGCVGQREFTMLDDFADGDEENEVGGWWYTVTDSGDASVPKDMADKSKGSSRAKLVVTGSADGSAGMAALTSQLDRTLGSAWHPDAGWAYLGVGFSGGGGLWCANSLSAIQFQIKVEYASKSVEAVRLKVFQDREPDSVAFFASLPVSELTSQEGRTACIGLDDLRPPKTRPSSSTARFNPAEMVRIAWETKMADASVERADTASARFWISDVRLVGFRCDGIRDRGGPTRGLSVRASNGILHLSGIQGTPRFEVVSMQGRKVASFSPAPTIALDLPRGTYHLVGMRDGVRVVKTFAVVR